MTTLALNSFDLPKELWHKIFLKLSVKDLIVNRVCCKFFKEVISNVVFFDLCKKENLSLVKVKEISWLKHYLTKSSFIIKNSKKDPFITRINGTFSMPCKTAVSNGKIYIGYSNGQILEVNLSKKKAVKIKQAGGQGISCFYTLDSWLVSGSWDGQLMIYKEGIIKGEKKVSQSIRSLLIYQNSLLFSFASFLAVVDMQTFQETGKFSLKFEIEKILNFENRLYFLTSQKDVYTCDFPLSKEPVLIKEQVAQVFIWNEWIVFGKTDKKIEVENLSTCLATVIFEGELHDIKINQGLLCIISENCNCSAWSLADEKWVFKNFSLEGRVSNFCFSSTLLIASFWSKQMSYLDLETEHVTKKPTEFIYFLEIFETKVIFGTHEAIVINDYLKPNLPAVSH